MGQFKKILDAIKEALKDSPRGMTITEIASHIDLNRNSTARYLDVLLISGQVEMKSVGAAKLYFLSPRLPVEAVLDLSEEGILMLNSKLQIIRVNETFTKFADIDSEDLIGSSITKHNIGFLFDEIAASSIRDAINGNQVSYETEIQYNGTERHLQVKFIPTTFDDGEPGVTVITEDITSRKAAERQIKKQSEFLSLVMESVAHPFYVIDANDYSIKMANKSARLGALTSDSTCHSLTHNSSSPCSGDVHPCPLRAVKASRKPVVVEHTHHNVSGRTRHLEIHAHPIFDDDGNVSQMIEYNLDITDRKQVEEQLRSEVQLLKHLVDSLDQALILIQNDVIVFSNRAFNDILGYSVDSLQGHQLKNFMKKKSIGLLKKLSKHESTVVELIGLDKQVKVFEITSVPLSDLDESTILYSFLPV